MSKPKAPLIPTTKATAKPAEPKQRTAEDILADAKAQLDAVMEVAMGMKKVLDLFYSEILTRQNYINSLPPKE